MWLPLRPLRRPLLLDHQDLIISTDLINMDAVKEHENPHLYIGGTDDHEIPQDLFQFGERMESRDTTLFPNAMYRARKVTMQMLRKHVFALQTMTVLVAFSIAVVGAVVNITVAAIGEHKLHTFYHLLEHSAVGGYGMLLGTNFALILFATALAAIEPRVQGSGIPEVKTLLNGLNLKGVTRLKTLFFKVLALICTVSSGLPLGKEGPMIHIGAMVAAGMSQGKSSYRGFDLSFTKFQEFRNDKAKRDFIAGGTAAGVAAAFGAPIAGMFFALEEGTSFWSQPLTLRIFLCTVTSAAVVSIILRTGSAVGLQTANGSVPGFFSLANPNATNPVTTSLYELYELPLFIILGLIGGMFGALFNSISIIFSRWRSKIFDGKKSMLVTESLLAVFIWTTLCWTLSTYGKSCATTARNGTDAGYIVYNCPEGEVSELGTLFLTGTEDLIKVLFYSDHTFSVYSLVLYAVLFFVGCVWISGTALPAGLFVPMMVLGSVIGRLFLKSIVACGYLHGATMTYSLVGAGCMVTGVTRAALTASLLLVEATGEVRFLLPLMISCLTAKSVGDLFGLGLYDLIIEFKHYLFLEADMPNEGYFLDASDIMNKDVKKLRRFCKVRDVVELFESPGGDAVNAIAIVREVNRDAKNDETELQSLSSSSRSLQQPSDHAFIQEQSLQEQSLPLHKCAFDGYILRRHLTTLLMKKAFNTAHPSLYLFFGANVSDYPEVIRWEALEAKYPHYITFEKARKELTDADLDKWMDLSPYMHQTPVLLWAHSPVSEVYQLFRTLGLRHLFLLHRDSTVAGLVTRKSLTHHWLHEMLCKRVAKLGAEIGMRPALHLTQKHEDLLSKMEAGISVQQEAVMKNLTNAAGRTGRSHSRISTHQNFERASRHDDSTGTPHSPA